MCVGLLRKNLELREKSTLVPFINEYTAIIFLNCMPNARKNECLCCFFAIVVFYAVFVMLCVVDIKGISTFFFQTLFIVGNRVQTVKRCKVFSFVTTYLKALIVFCD